MARPTERKLFRFLISTSGVAAYPFGSSAFGTCTFTFASHRRLPSCISQSDTPSSRSIRRISSRYAMASSGLFISGCETISNSGVPVRFRSTRVSPPRPDSSWTFLPASSSRCARMMPTRLAV